MDLIFASFISVICFKCPEVYYFLPLFYAQESLVSHAYEFMRIDGTTKAFDRLKIVNVGGLMFFLLVTFIIHKLHTLIYCGLFQDFQEGRGASIFLLTSQVGGLGLTLTKADRVIVVDPAWNPR